MPVHLAIVRKAANVGSIAERTGILIRLYNPRIDKWPQHFQLNGPRIAALSEIGEVTVKTLRFNDDERLLEREILQTKGRYPSAAATRRLVDAS